MLSYIENLTFCVFPLGLLSKDETEKILMEEWGKVQWCNLVDVRGVIESETSSPWSAVEVLERFGDIRVGSLELHLLRVNELTSLPIKYAPEVLATVGESPGIFYVPFEWASAITLAIHRGSKEWMVRVWK